VITITTTTAAAAAAAPHKPRDIDLLCLCPPLCFTHVSAEQVVHASPNLKQA
jgi:hypothetical protein